MASLPDLIENLHVYLAAIAISCARGLAFFSVMPIITRIGLPRGLQLFVITALSIPVIVAVAPQLKAAHPLSPIFVISVCLKEVLIGLLLGIITGLPFWAMEMAGNIVDFVRQAPDAEVQDPQGTTQSSITGTAFSVFVTLYFVSMGGLTLLADAIYTSFDIWPALAEWPDLSMKGAQKCIDFLDSLMQTSLLLAAPLIVFIMIAFFIVALLARALPQLNVFIVSMSSRSIAFLIAMQVYGVYLVSNFTSNGTYVREAIPILKAFVDGK